MKRLVAVAGLFILDVLYAIVAWPARTLGRVANPFACWATRQTSRWCPRCKVFVGELDKCPSCSKTSRPGTVAPPPDTEKGAA